MLSIIPYAYLHLNIFFGGVSIRSFPQFFNQITHFHIVKIGNSPFGIFWITVLYQMCLLQILYSSLKVLLIFTLL